MADAWIDETLNTAELKNILSNYKQLITGYALACKDLGWKSEEAYLYYQASCPPEKATHLPLIAYWIGLAFKGDK